MTLYSTLIGEIPHQVSSKLKITIYEINTLEKENISPTTLTGPYIIETIFVVPYTWAPFMPHDKNLFDYRYNITYYRELADIINNYLAHPSIKSHIRLKFVDVKFEYDSDLVHSRDPAKTYNVLHDYMKKKTLYVYDLAILISDKISSTGVLGYATGDVCKPGGNRIMVQDMGYDTARVIVHELGHCLSAQDEHKTQCSSENEKGIMDSGSGLSRKYIWSKCSQKAITESLRTKGSCYLRRRNSDPEGKLIRLNFIDKNISFDHQCRVNWDIDHTFLMTDSPTPCKELRCHGISGVKTIHERPIDGTSCSRDNKKICFRGNCLEKSELGQVNDISRWAQWGPWSKCNGNDFVGYKTRERECNVDGDKGGLYCKNDYKMLAFCKNDNSNYIVENQRICSKHHPGSEYKEKITYPCKLACFLRSSLYIMTEDVVDGTPFSQTGLCVNGYLYLNSKATHEKARLSPGVAHRFQISENLIGITGEHASPKRLMSIKFQ
ncbi:A disintegrin and metalloproteinase with thrombospondin motifs 4-like [Gordionus sp. m RMFG-2023]|uniref:A disintegrin and metalloproteinase with thrombospondin motifs 4-like n=1 Tax=Gordionus sp. m RMFG-2023 TaxID=3053472 RepID=UPI0031FDDCF3